MWGYSPPLDFNHELSEYLSNSDHVESIEVLIVGARDARHILKTMASSYLYSERNINYHVIESNPEHIARSILLMAISLQSDLGLQEASRYYLETLGNTLVTPATAKFLIKTVYKLIDVVTQTVPCPWLDVQSLKYKERDLIEGVFKFWVRALSEGIPIVEYWDRRVRKALGTRYDYREGVFDWDFHMVLDSKQLPHLTLQEYRFWRNNGIAFTWLESEPARSNPTLISHILPHGEGFYHFAYSGDVVNGPYLTWALDEVSEKNRKLRATYKAEGQILKAIYQVREGELCPDSLIAAHRDKSTLNGTLITEMPSMEIEQEQWKVKSSAEKSREPVSWVEIPKSKILFHSISNYERYKNNDDWRQKINVVFVAHNMINHLSNIVSLMKTNAILIVESCKYLVDIRKESQEDFAVKLKNLAIEMNLKSLQPFNPHKDNFAHFIKKY